MSRLTISVALCTCNGERYLREQLDSIARQTRQPDELVVCDDVSADRTVEIIHGFSTTNPFPVKLFVNERRLGSSKNFERAILECSGDIIVLSDQDDVWLDCKLEAFEALFNSFPDTDMAFSDADIVDQSLKPAGYTLWNAMRFSQREWKEVESGKALQVLLRRNVVQGAAMALHRRIRQHVLPVPDGVVHDAWIATQVAVTGRIRLVPRSLALYRQHGANQIGMRRVDFFERLRTSCERSIAATYSALRLYEQVYQRLHDPGALKAAPALLASLAAKVDHLRNRLHIGFRERGWLVLLAIEAFRGHYHRYSFGWWSVGHDLIKCHFPRAKNSQKERSQ